MLSGKPFFTTRASVVSTAVFMATVVGLGFFYTNTFGSLLVAWNEDEYSHGILLPVISLLWGLRLLQQKPVMPQPALGGMGILLAGIVLNLAGGLIANNWLSEISLVIAIIGLVGFFLGYQEIKQLAPPLFFLFFAVPLPVTVTPLLTAKMQLLSSDLGVAGLRLFGVSVYQEGNVIDLGTVKLQVAEACSGLRYMFPLMSLGYLVAFHVFESTWRRGAVFLSTIPIAILMNGLRIMFTGIAANALGAWVIEGVLHEIEGFAVFAFCLLFIAGVIFALKKIGPKDEAPSEYFLSLNAPFWTNAPRLSLRAILTVLLVVFLSAASSLVLSHRSAEAFPVRKPFADFPLSIGDWAGTTKSLSKVESETLKLTDYLLTSYSLREKPYPVEFYVAYYESQRQGHSIHSPQVCLPGGGWEILSRDVVSVSLRTGASLFVNREVIQKGKEKNIVYYWFNESGNDAATNFEAKWQLMKNSVKSGRTDGSLIRLTTPVTNTQSLEQAESVLRDFLNSALPLLRPYIPTSN